MQTALFDQRIPEPAELETTLIIIEVGPGDHAKEHISEARSVAIAVLETEIHHSADYERKQTRVGKQGCRKDLGPAGRGVDCGDRPHPAGVGGDRRRPDWDGPTGLETVVGGVTRWLAA